MTHHSTGRVMSVLRWDSSGAHALLVPDHWHRIPTWRWSLIGRRSQIIVSARLAFTERAAHRRAWRAFQKAARS